MGEDRVLVRTAAEGVATVTMVRADKHNALDQAMFDALIRAVGSLNPAASGTVSFTVRVQP